MYNISCPAGFDCDVGPVTSVTGYSITYCNYATTDDVSTDAWWAWVSLMFTAVQTQKAV